MRVLITTDTVGGVWTFTKELAAGLLEKGCEVALVSIGRKPAKEHANWARIMQQQSRSFRFQSLDAPLEWMQTNDRALTGTMPCLLKAADNFGADVLHSNQFCFGTLPIAIPKIVTAHSDVLTWSEICHEAPLQSSPWIKRYRRLVHEGLQGADGVVAPTQWMLNSLAQHFPLPQTCHVIPNGRNVHVSRGSSEQRTLQVITAGRLWDEAKGIAMLRDVSSPMPLLVAGDATCESSRAPLNLGSAKLLGPLPQPALLELFQQSAIYLCTSRYEPFGLAPLEAALCGCAVIANDLPSLREVWGAGAIYFRGATSLSHLLHTLHDDSGFLQQSQLLSYTRARTFTREAMASSYLNLYQSLKQCREELVDVA